MRFFARTCSAFVLRNAGVDVVNRTDVRVVQGGSRACFALKTLERDGIVGQFLRQKFQRNVTPQLCILCPLNNAHPAATEPVQDAIMRNDLSVHPDYSARNQPKRLSISERSKSVDRASQAG